jgi:hypothetical protein
MLSDDKELLLLDLPRVRVVEEDLEASLQRFLISGFQPWFFSSTPARADAP